MRGSFRRVALAITAVAVVAIAGGVTYAVADIGGGGVINGCYKSQNGQLRLIDPATDSCLPSETAISWGQTGTQGPPGASGRSGQVLYDQRRRLVGVVVTDTKDAQSPPGRQIDLVALPPVERRAPECRRVGG